MRRIGNMTLETPTDRDILMSREFDAPKHLVYEAYTTPELIKRWLGAMEGWTFEVCEVDLRVGGAYRYEWHGPGGIKMGMGGVYREIVTNERLVATEKFDESWYPGEAVETVEFVERAGRTTLKITVRYDSKEARDAVLKTPAGEGMAAGLEKLAELLATKV